jgi:hypothetical protein
MGFSTARSRHFWEPKHVRMMRQIIRLFISAGNVYCVALAATDRVFISRQSKH